MTRGTVIMVVLAALGVAGAVSMRPVELPPPTFEDTGEELFPSFQDPNAAAFLEVRSYDEENAGLTVFSVKLDKGRWVIPSHNNYPADGTEQMGKAAASFLGAKKDVVRSDDPAEHAKFGVLDPEDTSGTDDTGPPLEPWNPLAMELADFDGGPGMPQRVGEPRQHQHPKRRARAQIRPRQRLRRRVFARWKRVVGIAQLHCQPRSSRRRPGQRFANQQHRSHRGSSIGELRHPKRHKLERTDFARHHPLEIQTLGLLLRKLLGAFLQRLGFGFLPLFFFALPTTDFF